jgi:hypothetical protein
MIMNYDDIFLTYEEFTDRFGSNRMEFKYQLFNETFLEDVNEMIQESINNSGGLSFYETSPMRNRLYYELFGDIPGIRISGITSAVRGIADIMYLDILLKDKNGNIHLFSYKISGRGDEWQKDIVISSGEPKRIVDVTLTDVNASLEITKEQRKVKVYDLEKFPVIKGIPEFPSVSGLIIQEIYNAASDFPQKSFFEVDFVIDIMPFEERPREGTYFMNWVANPLNS